MKSKSQKFNDFLPSKLFSKKKKSEITPGQKVAYTMMSVVLLVTVGPEVVTFLYNYINRSETLEVRLPQNVDLFPDQESDEEKAEQVELNKQNNNFSFSYLKSFLRPQIEEKLGFEIEGDFDVLAVAELNLRSDAFESKDTRLCILIKPEHGKVFCVTFNNKYSQVEIEKEGTQSDAISSLVAHLQNSSIESIEINDEFHEDMIQNLPEQNLLFFGQTRTFIEKNGEKSYMAPVFVQDGDNIVLKTFKALQTEVDKAELTPEEALASTLYGDEGALMQEYSNQKQQDLSHLNNVLYEIQNNKTQIEQPNKDLFPDDYYADFDPEQTKE